LLYRWKVERTFAWLGNFRRLLVRHERYLSTFRAFFLTAFNLMSLKRFSEMSQGEHSAHHPLHRGRRSLMATVGETAWEPRKRRGGHRVKVLR
jgi:hypothetical protein